MPRNGMLRIHASLAAAVDGSSAVARATNTARATKARFMGLPFIIKRERLGAGEDQKRRLHTSVHNRSGNGWVPCPRSQVGRGGVLRLPFYRLASPTSISHRRWLGTAAGDVRALASHHRHSLGKE